MGFVTHGEIPLSADEQLACGDGVNGAWRRRQGHCLEDRSVIAHQGDARDLQPEAACLLRSAKQATVFPSVASRVLNHAALGATEDTDLVCALLWNEAAIVAATTHDCWCSSSRNGLREGRGASAVVVLSLAGRDVATVDGGVGVAAVGVKIARDLSINDA
jgi:hypothetical protein